MNSNSNRLAQAQLNLNQLILNRQALQAKPGYRDKFKTYSERMIGARSGGATGAYKGWTNTRNNLVTNRSTKVGHHPNTPYQIYYGGQLINSRNIDSKKLNSLNSHKKQLVKINKQIWQLEKELGKQNHHVYNMYAKQGIVATERQLGDMINRRIKRLDGALQDAKTPTDQKSIQHQINQYTKLKPSDLSRKGVGGEIGATLGWVGGVLSPAALTGGLGMGLMLGASGALLGWRAGDALGQKAEILGKHLSRRKRQTKGRQFVNIHKLNVNTRNLQNNY